MKHSKLPWKLRELSNGDCFVEGGEVVGKTMAGEYRREIMSDETYPEKVADGKFIVTACNNHEALVSVLETFIEYYDQAGMPADLTDDDEYWGIYVFSGDEVLNVRKARAALAKVRGEGKVTDNRCTGCNNLRNNGEFFYCGVMGHVLDEENLTPDWCPGYWVKK